MLRKTIFFPAFSDEGLRTYICIYIHIFIYVLHINAFGSERDADALVQEAFQKRRQHDNKNRLNRPTPRVAIGRRSRHLPRKSARIPGNGPGWVIRIPHPATRVTPLYLLPLPYFVYTAHRAAAARTIARSFVPITTADYSAAADRVGRQQRRGRGPDPGRRDRETHPAGPGRGPATPRHRLDNSISRQCHYRAGQFGRQ